MLSETDSYMYDPHVVLRGLSQQMMEDKVSSLRRFNIDEVDNESLKLSAIARIDDSLIQY